MYVYFIEILYNIQKGILEIYRRNYYCLKKKSE